MKKYLEIKFLFCVALVFASTFSYGQETEARLNVVGVARVSVTPDVAVLTLSAKEFGVDMSTALERLRKKTASYTELFQTLDFKREEVKTTAFDVSKNRIYSNNKYIDTGYIASQNMLVEFTYTQEKLTAILNMLAKSKEDIDFTFSFKLSELLKQEVQAEVINKSVADGKKKAKLIAQASGQVLGVLVDITYGSFGNNYDMRLVEGEFDMAPPPMKSSGVRSYLAFTPKDITFKDSMTLIYLINAKK